MGKARKKLTHSNLEQWRKIVRADKSHAIIRNAITSIGSSIVCTDPDAVNRVSHIFSHTLKRRHTRATNQEASGRCWMFAALNSLRHMVMHAMNIDNFEFSQTYLFFYDKLERSNAFLHWFIDNPEDAKPGSRWFEYHMTTRMTDGGFWQTFSNLVTKYGLVPKTAMGETFQSSDSDDMNVMLATHLKGCAMAMIREGVTEEEKYRLKGETMKNVYDLLVKYLGTPPETFDWTFDNAEGSSRLGGLTPMKFAKIIFSKFSAEDYVVLADLPHVERNKLYRIAETRNVQEGSDLVVLNLPVEDLEYYAKKSLERSVSAWCSADVRRGFDFFHSTLDESLHNTAQLFGSSVELTKTERLQSGELQGCHAMNLVGMDIDPKTKQVTAWQIENSWGYFNNEEPGLDGFLHGSRDWFTKNVVQLAIMRKFLKKKHTRLLGKQPDVLPPWTTDFAALFVKGVNNPRKNMPNGWKKAQAQCAL